MKDVDPLLRTDRPKPDESPLGFIARLAELNDYDSPLWIINLAEMRDSKQRKGYAFIVNKQIDLAGLSHLTQVSIAELQQLLYPPGEEKKNIVFGNYLPRYNIRFNSPKICPSCFRESGYIRKLWELSAVTCCPVHKCMLIDTCPHCHQRIRWNNRISSCSCGFRWDQAIPQQVAEQETALSEQIFTLCGQHESISPLIKETPLNYLNLENLLKAMFFIAGQLVNRTDTTGKFVATLKDNEKRHSLLSMALSVFMNWPSNYFELLDQITQRQTTSSCVTGIGHDFGYFYPNLYKEMSSLDFLKKSFEEYLYINWNNGYVNKKLKIENIDLDKRGYVSKIEAAKILKIEHEGINRLMTQGKLAGFKKKAKNRTIYLIEKESLYSLKEAFSNAISFKEARAFLSVGENTLINLLESGLIKPLRGPGEDGCFRWKFTRESLESFLVGIEPRKVTVNRVIKETISFNKALKKLIFLGIETADFIKLIHQNIILPCGCDNNKKGLQRLLFFTSDILDYINNQVLLTRKSDSYSIREVSNMLDDGGQSTYILHKKGFFGEIVKGRFGSSTISQEAIENFKAKYVFTAALAKEIGVSSRFLIEQLCKRGIVPVSGPKINGSPKYLFRKEDIEKITKKMIKGYSLKVDADKGEVSVNKEALLFKRILHNGW